ncbi:hypothetical protein QYF36_003616 [Acer negundo]|nr:hypothetical protein QYF36_003616 [Acer negundo]
MLKDEEEGVEGEVETTEIVFDSGGLIEVPDPDDSPIKANSGSDLMSPMLNLNELKGVEPEASNTFDSTTKKSVREVTDETPPFEVVQELPNENLEVEAIGDLLEEKPSEETNVKWLEEPAIVEIKDVKEEAPTPTLTPTIEMVEKLQEASVKNTAAHLVANRPNPWPNKQSINTNPNRPNIWPNKLSKITYFIRPKPWPDEPPIHKHNLRRGLEETRKLTYIHGEDEEEVTRGVKEEILGVVLVEKVKDFGVVLIEACRKKEEDWCFVEEETAIVLSKRRRSLIVDFHTVRFSDWNPGSKRRACMRLNTRCKRELICSTTLVIRLAGALW